MKTTAMGIILELTAKQKEYIDNLMDNYCAAVRWAFKRLLDGWKVQDIRITVQEKFRLNSRQANDAVYDAQTIIKSQYKLVQMHYENAKAKVEFTEKRIAKAKSPAKIAKLQKRLEKEQRKLAFWQNHLDNNTFPPVVFGGKKLFQERCKGNITREEWQEVRSNRYLSRGDKTKGGNLNTRIYEDQDQIHLDIAADPVQKGKSVRYNRITVPIYLAQKPSKKTGKINGINYRQTVLDYLKTGSAYQVEILRRDGKYYVHVSIEEEVPMPYNHKGAFGIDANPDGLGVTQVDCLGQYRGSEWLGQGEWTYARTNRRNNQTCEMAKKVILRAKEKGYALAVEDLKFKNDKSVTAKFNRMSHSFVWSKFLKAVDRCAAREGVPILKVKPAFTSVIGILKYQHMYGIAVHEAAGYVIARRGLGFDHEKIPKVLLDKLVKKKPEFKQMTNWKQWSAVKKSVLAKIKKITKRKKVNSLVSWQIHRKNVLGIG
ncbi:transposase, IS605 OrfB family [Desulfofarcimen acetoxidans DSM 771]|uniref:Transposase, IS605 OrfB family n=1 Tax=Desulfofarcimen acetoxidans (strain ATCC 49208 / DSM 771 / KCTC 5769 / VKM B-1644 / 5575) TaxID=485916 RepID=C8W4C4_DESAS|nr:IS200/IS605 family element transposase accessory protein TnpB [Desulfofarcimen acetoxidans]ACV61992.1 transposase, IS605 OrfB family [Desulfofarcimen acetoxidans DSM 771]